MDLGVSVNCDSSIFDLGSLPSRVCLPTTTPNGYLHRDTLCKHSTSLQKRMASHSGGAIPEITMQYVSRYSSRDTIRNTILG